MLQILQRLFRAPVRLFNPPSHTEYVAAENSVEDCLRQLEKEARLPHGDLRINGAPEKLMAFPAMREGLQYRIVSATSERWADDPDAEGYIYGTVFETEGPSNLSHEQLHRMTPLIAAVVAVPHVCVGRLNVVRNCPGIFQDNRCMSCGHKSHY